MKRILATLAILLCAVSVLATAQAQSITINGFEGEYSKPVIVNGIIYIATPSRLYTLNATDGFKLWSTGVDSDSIITSHPTIVNNFCYVTSNNNKLFVFNVLTGMAINIVPYKENDTTVEGVTLALSNKISSTATVIDEITYTVIDGVVKATTINGVIWEQNILDEPYGLTLGETIYDKQASKSSTPAPTTPPASAPTLTPTITPSPTPEPATDLKTYKFVTEPVNQNIEKTFAENSSTIYGIVTVISIIAIVACLVVKYKLITKLKQ